jgi:hypothetical protein
MHDPDLAVLVSRAVDAAALLLVAAAAGVGLAVRRFRRTDI